jgi:hypothetical protein
MNKIEKEIVALLKSGDFTIAFHDRGECSIYRGKFKYEKLPEKEDYTIQMGAGQEGYAPDVVLFLCMALGGKCISI